MIDKEQLFNTWAAPSSPWSAWAKPVLFAGMNERLLGDGPTATNKADEALRVEADEVPAASPQDPMAVVVDLPGAASIQMGVALAKLGYRPVPLFNGCDGPNAVIDLNGMIVWLIRAADDVARANLPESAPPATGVPHHGDPQPVATGLAGAPALGHPAASVVFEHPPPSSVLRI